MATARSPPPLLFSPPPPVAVIPPPTNARKAIEKAFKGPFLQAHGHHRLFLLHGQECHHPSTAARRYCYPSTRAHRRSLEVLEPPPTPPLPLLCADKLLQHPTWPPPCRNSAIVAISPSSSFFIRPATWPSSQAHWPPSKPPEFSMPSKLPVTLSLAPPPFARHLHCRSFPWPPPPSSHLAIIPTMPIYVFSHP